LFRRARAGFHYAAAMSQFSSRAPQRPRFVLQTGIFAWLALATLATLPSCGSTDTSPTSGTGGATTTIPEGELCGDPDPANLVLRMSPTEIAVPTCSDASGASCTTRTVKVRIDPDICGTRTVRFTSSDPSILPAPSSVVATLHTTTLPIQLHGNAKAGTVTLTASIETADDGVAATTPPVTTTLTVDVLDPTPIACAGTLSKDALAAGEALNGTGGLRGAAVSVPAGANAPNDNAFIWHINPIPAAIACGEDTALDGYVALGPAISFGPETTKLPREVGFSVPVNPALLPSKAMLRHVRMAYSSPAFKTPRTVPVANPRLVRGKDGWAFTFEAPRFGTYQAVVRKDAGETTHKRRLTHRAVIGVSMGGGGSAMMGMRHHDLFDVLAPLGGPVDWTWMLHHIEENHLGGFRPIAKGTQLADIAIEKQMCSADADCKVDERCLGASAGMPGKCTLMPTPHDPYEHPQTFDNWWYEYPRSGNGGTFARRDYSQIFRDLALMFGNPNGDNLAAGGENLPPGVPPEDPSQIGDHTHGECKVWVDPIDGPDHDKEAAIANSCPTERCKHTLTLNNYFDDEYNPDGTFPVITVCDGAGQNQSLSPYANTWSADGDDYPLEVALAVDYNGNGKRDELEPIIRSGHEPYYDDGVDGVPSAQEPGYAAGVNEDPAGDDYDAQYNPSGTERDAHKDETEKFDDLGLDGVSGTKQQPAYPVGYQKPGDGYDVGEGDGKYTESRGVQRFRDVDPHAIVRGWTAPPGGKLDDAALSRVDVWTDGGTRDLFNFGVAAQHLVGAFATRGRDVAYFNHVTALPGLDPSQPTQFNPSQIEWDELQGVIYNRYGHADPSKTDVDNGSGQHVGTAQEIASRLEAALYFIGSRWPAPELRVRVEKDSSDNAMSDAKPCEILGSCTFDFTSNKTGRTGPVGITFPPGYSNAKLQHIRYPVIYMLHGYGQNPQDLEAAIVFLRNWMNSPLDGSDSRLAKAILVYVDGRCRPNKDGTAECLRGTFFADSPRAEGVKDEAWWLDLMDYVDQHYRTRGEAEVDWTE